MTKEQQHAICENIRKTIGEEQSALISDDLANLESDYISTLNSVSDKDKSINDLKSRNDELISVNGRLFQRIGESQETKKPSENNDNEDDEPLDLSKIIDERGGIIK